MFCLSNVAPTCNIRAILELKDLDMELKITLKYVS